MSAFLPESDSEDELPPGWEERATIQGEVYYANHDQALTQWSHPRTGQRKSVSDKLPFGWERKILQDNKVVYVDHLNQRTTFTDPRLAFAVEKKSLETPFRQRFDASSTALQVLHGLDLSGQVAVVTGASSGIGFHTARALAFHGCEVVLACRDEARAEAAIRAIRADRPAARCHYLPLDLASLASVRQFVQRLAILHPAATTTSSLRLLVLNAGLFGLGHSRTEDGLERMMEVNYLAHFYLVRLLLSRLLTGSLTSRVVVLTSESHRFSEVTPETLSALQFSPLPSAFSSIMQYNDSKLFLLLFAQALHRKYRHMGLKCLAVHPGNLVYSGLKNSWWVYRLLFSLARPFTKSLPQAASSVVFALCSPDLDSVTDFTYINNCFPTKPSEVALSSLAADRLWEMSTATLEQILGHDALDGGMTAQL